MGDTRGNVARSRNEAVGVFGHQRRLGLGGTDYVLALCALLFVLTLGTQATTQWLAHRLSYQPGLGRPWVEARVNAPPLYPTWRALSWQSRLRGTSAMERLAQQSEAFLRLSLLSAMMTGAMIIAARRKQARNRISEIHGSARWATKEDIDRANLFSRDGVVVGGWVEQRSDRLRYLRHNGPEHVLTFAPTGSGKGVGLVIPTLLSWAQSALVLDPKGENFALTSGYRASLGHRVYRLDFAADPSGTAAFNPLTAVRVGTTQGTADAQRLARMIVDPDGKQFEGPGKHWAETGSSLLTGAMLHVLYRERLRGRVATLTDVIDELTDRRRTHDDVLASWLEFPHDPNYLEGWNDGEPVHTHPVVAATAREQLNREPKERGAVLSSSVAPLTLFRDPLLAANTSRSDFAIEDLMDAEVPLAVYLVLRPSDIHRLRPIVRIFMDLALRRLVETMTFVAGQQLPSHRHRLLLMLDEFPVLGKLDVFSESLAYIRGWGIKAYLIAQDYEQLRAAYGDRETISSNCHLKLAYAPTKLETAKLLSALVGNTTVIKRTPGRSAPWSSQQRSTETDQELARPLLTPDECMQLPGARKQDERIVEAGTMLIFASGFPAIYGKQTLFFLDPVLRARSRFEASSTVAESSREGRERAPLSTAEGAVLEDES